MDMLNDDCIWVIIKHLSLEDKYPFYVERYSVA